MLLLLYFLLKDEHLYNFVFSVIVECSGGVWKEGGSNWVCVSSTKDQALWPSLRKRGATVVTTEFILGGVLRQKIEINPNKFP